MRGAIDEYWRRSRKKKKKIRKLKKARRLLALGEIKSTALAVKSAKSQSIKARNRINKSKEEVGRILIAVDGKLVVPVSVYEKYVKRK